jgi:hypothetical protein
MCEAAAAQGSGPKRYLSLFPHVDLDVDVDLDVLVGVFHDLAAESAFSIKRDRVTLMAAVTHQSSRVGR